MSKEALIDSEQALGLDGLVQTIKHALIKVTSLVIHPRHDRV